MVLTGPGVAAIAVVRIAGPGVRPFLERYFSRPAVVGRCVHGTLNDQGRIIDDPVVAQGAGFADINLHGGRWIVSRVLELLCREGFAVKPSDSFPLAEWAADGNTDIEREVCAWLPLARTELAVRVLCNQPAAWESVKNAPPSQIQRMQNDRALVNLLRLPRVAIIGPPNVGKSTLANRLFEQDRSITADQPGTTRDWVGEIANLDGLTVMLIDTPGRRATADPIEQEAIERSGAVVAGADLMVLVMDASGEVNQPIRGEFPEAMLVMNKMDQVSSNRRIPAGAIATAATLGQGIDDLRRAIRAHFGCEGIDETLPRIWTDRQRALLIPG
jgi:tRNA modification GTPase